MNRLLLALGLWAGFAGAPGLAVSPSPAPAKHRTRITPHAATFSNKVRVHGGAQSALQATACGRGASTTAGNQGRTLGPNGASTSQTLVAVPLHGGSISSATRNEQMSEACAHRRN